MSVDKQTVLKAAKLARVKIDEQADGFVADLNKIIDMIEQLQEVDTDNIEPMAGVGDLNLRLREDVITDGNVKDAVLSNANDAQFDCFTVPKVVE